MKKIVGAILVTLSCLFLLPSCAEHHYYHHYHHHTRGWYDRHHTPPPSGVNFDIDVR